MQLLLFYSYVFTCLFSGYLITSNFRTSGSKNQRIIFTLIGYILLQGAIVQFLSLFFILNSYSAFTLNLLIFFSLICFKQQAIKNLDFKSVSVASIFNIKIYFLSMPLKFRILIYTWIFSIIILLISSPLGFLSADAYHWEMQKYWLQNNSIFNFGVVNDYKITNFTFLHEILILPFFLFDISLNYSTLLPIIFFILYPFLMADLAHNLSVRRYYGFMAALITLSYTVVYKSIFKGSVDFSAPFWIFVSIYLLINCRIKSSLIITPVIFSILSFCIALGLKNTTLFILPFYLFLLILILRKNIFELNYLKEITLSFIFGLILSGTIWAYLSNYLFYGDFKGYAGHILSNESFNWEGTKTRTIRGILYLISDFNYVPDLLKQKILNMHQFLYEIFNVSNYLVSEKGYYIFHEERLPTRSGYGFVGSILILPILINYIYSQVSNKFNKLQNFWLSVFLLSSLFYFVMIHAFLNWQPFGLFRLNIHYVLLTCPLLMILLTNRLAQTIIVFSSIAQFLFVSIYVLLISLPTDLFQSNKLWQVLQNERAIKPTMVTLKDFNNNITLQKQSHYPSCAAISLTINSITDNHKNIAFAGDSLEPTLCMYKNDLSVNVYPMNDHREILIKNNCPKLTIHKNVNYIFTNENMKECVLNTIGAMDIISESSYEDQIFTLYKLKKDQNQNSINP